MVILENSQKKKRMNAHLEELYHLKHKLLLGQMSKEAIKNEHCEKIIKDNCNQKNKNLISISLINNTNKANDLSSNSNHTKNLNKNNNPINKKIIKNQIKNQNNKKNNNNLTNQDEIKKVDKIKENKNINIINIENKKEDNTKQEDKNKLKDSKIEEEKKNQEDELMVKQILSKIENEEKEKTKRHILFKIENNIIINFNPEDLVTDIKIRKSGEEEFIPFERNFNLYQKMLKANITLNPNIKRFNKK